MYLCNKSIRTEKLNTKLMTATASRVGGKWNAPGQGNNGNFARNAFFLLLKKVLRQICQDVNICLFLLVSRFSLKILNIPFLN